MQTSKFHITLQPPLQSIFIESQLNPSQNSQHAPTQSNQQNSNIGLEIEESQNSELLRNQNEQIKKIDECKQDQGQKVRQDNVLVEQNKTKANDQKEVENQVLRKKSYNFQDKNKLIKCENKICNSIENIKKIKSKVCDKFLYFCLRCCERYVSNAYCYYCEQIYLSQYQCDGLQWIQCENCERWNHTECQKQNNGSKSNKKNENYLCLDCEKKSKRKRNHIESYQFYEYEKNKKKMNIKNKQQVGITQKIKIFRQKKQIIYAYLDSFLTGFGYKLALSQDQINKDLFSIRQNNEMENLMKIKNDNTNNSARKKKR